MVLHGFTTLDDLVLSAHRNELELPMGKVKNWVTQLCMALKHVHKLRIVHRDVKGSNMFITGVAWIENNK